MTNNGTCGKQLFRMLSDSEEKTNLRLQNDMNFKLALGFGRRGAVRSRQSAPRAPRASTTDKRHQRLRLKIRYGAVDCVIAARAFFEPSG